MNKLPPRFRHYLRHPGYLAPLTLVAGLLLLAWLSWEEPDSESLEAPRPIREQATAAPQPAPQPDPVPPPDAAAPPQAGTPDIFAVRNWEPPPPPVVAAEAEPAPPPPPEPPPLPFRFMGKLIEPGQAPVFFLAYGETVIAVRPGQKVDDQYRVGQYKGGELQFIFLPMKVRQTLAIGSES